MKRLFTCALALLAGFLSTNALADGDPTGVYVDGVDVSALSGDGWNASLGSDGYAVNLTANNTYVLNGENTNGYVRIYLAANTKPTLVVSNLTLSGYTKSSYSGISCSIGGNVDASIVLKGVNEIHGGSERPAIYVGPESGVSLSGDGALAAFPGDGHMPIGIPSGSSIYRGDVDYYGGLYNYEIAPSEAADAYCVRTVSVEKGGFTFISEIQRFVARGLKVNGTDVGYFTGYGWKLSSEDDGTEKLTLNGGSNYKLTGGATNIQVLVSQSGATVTVSNLHLHADASYTRFVWTGLLSFRDADSATLELTGENVFTWLGNYIGAGVNVRYNTHLTIREKSGTSGSLWVEGGYYGAGIGGYCSSSGPITIESGTITAIGGIQGAGIGAGDGCGRTATNGTITITGGRIEATGGRYGAAIGGGYSSDGGVIRITGGTVYAAEDPLTGVSIGAGKSGSGTYVTTITGGSIGADGSVKPQPTNGSATTWRVTVPCNAAGPVTVAGLGDYGVSDLYPRDGSLWFYLPDGDYDFTVDDIEYVATVAGAATTARVKSTTVTLTLPNPLDEHIESVDVSTNGISVTGVAGVYTLATNASVRIEAVACDGWRFEGVGKTNEIEIAALSCNRTISADELGIPVLDITYCQVIVERPMPVGVTFVSAYTNDVDIGTGGIYRVIAGSSFEANFTTDSDWVFATNGLHDLKLAYDDVQDDLTIKAEDLAVRRAPVSLTVPHPLPEHVAGVEVTQNDIPLNGSVSYSMAYGSRVVVTFSAESGYEFVTGKPTHRYEWTALTTNVTISAEDLPALQTVDRYVKGVLSNGTLTVVFDKLDHSAEGTVYLAPAWTNVADSVTNVTIADSMADVALTNVVGWFAGCVNLVRIDVPDDYAFPADLRSDNLFAGCSKLVGGCGTRCDGIAEIDADRACVDAGTIRPGYFTATNAYAAAIAAAASGFTNLYHSVTGACEVLAAGDTLFLLADYTGDIDLDRGFALTLDGRGFTISSNDTIAISADSSVTIRNTRFAGETNGLAFAQISRSGALALDGVTVDGWGTTNAPLVHSDCGTLSVTRCAFSNDFANSFFRIANSALDFEAVQLTDATFADNTFSNLVDVISGGVTLGGEFWSEPVRLKAGDPLACVAPTGTVPAGDVFLCFDNPAEHIDATIVSNAHGVALAAENVRVMSAGYAAFGSGGNLTLEAAWMRPFVNINGSATNAFETAAEALASAGSAADLWIASYRNDALGFTTNLVAGSVTVASNKTVTLKSILRVSTDGVHTGWSTNALTTLSGALTVFGTAVIENVALTGPVTIYDGGILRFGRSFSFGGRNLYITLDDPAAMSGIVVTADAMTSEEMKQYCRITNPGWTFDPVAGGLEVVQVTDIVARIGETEYHSIEAALSAATNCAVIECVSHTNVTTGAHTDAIAASSRELAIADGMNLTLASSRRMVTGTEVSWDVSTNVITGLDLDGVTLTIGKDSTLDLANVSVTGTLKLAGEGWLIVTNYAGAQISLAFDEPEEEASIYQHVAHGPLENFKLVTSVGELVQDGEEVYWFRDWFSWSYYENGNGVAYITVNDGGDIFRDIKVTNTVGTFVYQYTRVGTLETVPLKGYLLYVDYGKTTNDIPHVCLPTEVSCEYLNTENAWTKVKDGDLPDLLYWYRDEDGGLKLRFSGDSILMAYGIVTADMNDCQRAEICTDVVNDEHEDDDGLSEALAMAFAGASAVGIGAGMYGLLQMGAGFGAAGGLIGAGGGAGLAPRDFGDRARDDAHGNDPEHHGDRWHTFLKWAGKFFDVYTVVQAIKDLIQIIGCPIEYKGVPYFAYKFGDKHADACEDDEENAPIHFFFATDVDKVTLPTSGNVDIDAEFGWLDLLEKEFVISSWSGSPLERFQNSMTVISRLFFLYDLDRKRKWSSSATLTVVGEVIALLKGFYDIAEANGYFDPPKDSSVTVSSGCGYTIMRMEFGTMGQDPKEPRTAPILVVESGAKLKLDHCSFGGYTYNCPHGLVYVKNGGTLSLDNTHFNGCTSVDGTPAVVAEPGATIWMGGSTSASDIIADGADIRVGYGPYRYSDPNPKKLSGTVTIGGEPTIGGKVGSVEFFDDTTNSYSNIKSAKYDRVLRTSVEGADVVWRVRDEIPQIGDTVWADVYEGVCTVFGTGDAWVTLDPNPLTEYKKSIKSVTVRSGVTSLSQALFYKFPVVTNITVSADVTNVADHAFYGCHSLKKVQFLGDTPTLGEQAIQYTAAIRMLLGTTPYVYTIPEVDSASLTIWAKDRLTDKAWTNVTDTNQFDRAKYHFFKVELNGK